MFYFNTKIHLKSKRVVVIFKLSKTDGTNSGTSGGVAGVAAWPTLEDDLPGNVKSTPSAPLTAASPSVHSTQGTVTASSDKV